MTREEAIKQLKDDRVLCINSETEPFAIAYDMAIKALEEPCEDAISRQVVLDMMQMRMGGKELYKAVYELPSVTPTPKWIPVSENLPEESVDVICCTDAKEVFTASYLGKLDDGAECFDDDNGMMCEGDVVAWMPLPEPYKAEMESEDDR